MNSYRLLFALCFLIALPPFLQGQTRETQPQTSGTPSSSPSTKSSAGPAYQLSGDTLAKAIQVSRIRAVVHFVDAGWSIAIILILLAVGVPAKFRDWALAASSNLWVQCLVFLPLLMLIMSLLALPIDVYMQHVDRSYALSVQSWGGWLWDQTKEFLISTAILYVPAVLLFFLLRRSPRRWWLWLWAASIPFTIFVLFLAPVVIDPLMNKFEPLARSDPALVKRLEKIVARGGLEIPPQRMFLMKASKKTTELNAYVTGVGASKRIVVWDTSIGKATPDEISFIFAHEMGHYVLHHISLGIAFGSALSFFTFWAAFHVIRWLIRRFGAVWRVRSTHDWAALGVMVLVLNVFSFFLDPIVNGFSRWEEHQADIYGEEAIHGIVRDPQQTARKAFQMLGETSLVDPSPNPFVEFWTGSHPSIAQRAAFAENYDPWEPGREPKYFPKRR